MLKPVDEIDVRQHLLEPDISCFQPSLSQNNSLKNMQTMACGRVEILLSIQKSLVSGILTRQSLLDLLA